jgi:hypothetical protein
MAAKPIVDGIERDYQGRLTVVRIDILKPESDPWKEEFGFQYTPTFVLLDGSGEVVLQSIGAIDPLEVQRALDEM